MQCTIRTSTFPRISSATTMATVVGISLAAASFSTAAEACDCAIAEPTVPNTTDTKVPANTKIWTTQFGCDQAVLQKADGTPVPTTFTQFGRTGVIKPNADLEMGVTYELTNCNGFPSVISTFTVTEGPDTTPPEKPVFTMGETKSSGSSLSSCGEELYVPLEVSHQGTVLVLDVAGRSTLDPQTLTGKPVDAFFPSDTPLIGHAICSSHNWDFDTDGDAVNTRLGAFDLAGNFSGMTDPLTVEPSCTCTTPGKASSGNGYAIGVVAVGLAVMRTRRTTKSR